MDGNSHFGDRLSAAVAKKESSVCVGLDPRWSQLPSIVRAGIDERNLNKVARATEVFCNEVVDAVADVVPIVKPQAAFFEQLGPAGLQALANVIAHARRCGLLILLDAKRGDIGSTASSYAAAYLGESSPWGCDALTVNPYLGNDTLEPFVARANAQGAGIFVLVKTSNPGSGFLQDQETANGRIYQQVAGQVQQWGKASAGVSHYGNVGAVVGATYPEQLLELRRQMPNSWILIPGFGAQGGTAEDVRLGFDQDGSGAIVNSSRGIIFAYEKDSSSAADWQSAVREAALEMRAALRFQ